MVVVAPVTLEPRKLLEESAAMPSGQVSRCHSIDMDISYNTRKIILQERLYGRATPEHR
jgi:hypothetical protein